MYTTGAPRNDKEEAFPFLLESVWGRGLSKVKTETIS